MNDLKSDPADVSTPLNARHLADGIVQILPRLLGALFLFTAIQKIRQPASLAAVFQFDGFPESLVSIAVWTITIVELVLGGLLLVFLRLHRIILLATAVLLVIYIAQLGYLLISNQAPSCGCFGTEAAPSEARMTNLLSLARNLCLLWPVIWTRRQLSLARKTL